MAHSNEKKCKSCGQTKAASEFYENPFSPDGLYAFCKPCFDRFAKKLPAKTPEPQPGPARERFLEPPSGTAEAAIEINALQTQNAPKPEPSPAPAETPASDPNTEPALAPATPVPPIEDFDFIGHLLENATAEQNAREIKGSHPRQINKITPRRRICAGCGKVEDIDEVEKNTVIPVHAWFCGWCRDRGIRRRVIKGMRVFDYWGREFIVKKYLNPDAVLGAPKSKTFPGHRKSLKIYGAWKES